MKKPYLALLAIVLLSTATFSQEKKQNESKSENFNEVKINGLYLVLGAFDITYERTISEESAFGLNVFLPFDDDINDDVNYYISPYYRFYFGKKYAAGFFLEGFGMLNSIKEYSLSFNNNTNLVTVDENVTDFALGIGLGGKWVTKRGVIGEINFGIGRNLFNNDNSNTEAVAKLGITIGYRF